jgi:hypothetical protein
MNFRRISFLFILLIVSIACRAQKLVKISGIIVDSVTLVALPHAHIQLKSSKQSWLGSSSGSFTLTAPVFDTLIFSCVGYKSIEYPVLLSDEDVLIRIAESYVMLPEVTTVGARILQPTYGERRRVVSPTPTLAEGIFSPFTYLSKTEREKRRLIKVREENVKIRTFVEVVNDPDLKKDITNQFGISEQEYYTLLAKFNTENKYAQYLDDENKIRDVIFSFIKKELSKK